MHSTNPGYGSEYLLRRNLILSEGLIIAPAACCTDTLPHAAAACFVFCCLSALTVLLGACIPHRIPFAFRILSYSVIAALVYIPTAFAADYLFGAAVQSLYLPLMSVGLFLTAEHDILFCSKNLKSLLGTMVCILIGVSAVLLVMGCLREFFGMGSVWETRLIADPPLPALLTPACGMILLACFCASAHILTRSDRKEAADDACGN